MFGACVLCAMRGVHGGLGAVCCARHHCRCRALLLLFHIFKMLRANCRLKLHCYVYHVQVDVSPAEIPGRGKGKKGRGGEGHFKSNASEKAFVQFVQGNIYALLL